MISAGQQTDQRAFIFSSKIRGLTVPLRYGETESKRGTDFDMAQAHGLVVEDEIMLYQI